jgi:hypothetical protein
VRIRSKARPTPAGAISTGPELPCREHPRRSRLANTYGVRSVCAGKAQRTGIAHSVGEYCAGFGKFSKLSSGQFRRPFTSPPSSQVTTGP